MLRLVERLIGEGHLHDPKAPGAPLSTAYELDVYRDWQVEAGAMVAGEWVIEGHLLAPPDALAALAGRAAPSRCTWTTAVGSRCSCSTARDDS